MSRQKVTASLVVRVIEGRNGPRIVLHDLRSRAIREFRSWDDALAHMRALTARSGLR